MRLTERAHDYLSRQLRPGDRALDATAGNGHDSLYMAKRVGPKGHLIAIDIQPAAIRTTRRRLQVEDCCDQTELLVADHSQALPSLYLQYPQAFRAIIFNLGYLPGSDKRIQTQVHSTIGALNAATGLLIPDGLLLVTAYRGHIGGQAEARCIADWMQNLHAQAWSVKRHEPVSIGTQIPPVLWVARKID